MLHENVDGSSCTNRKTLLNTACNSEQDVYLVNAIPTCGGERFTSLFFRFLPEQVSIFVWIAVMLLVSMELG